MAIVLGAAQMTGQSKVGTTAASFLGIPVGAKAMSMGAACTAIGDDPGALAWNPGVIQSEQMNFYASQTAWLVGSTHQFIGAQIHMTPNDAFGISIVSLDYGTREKVTTVAQPDGTGEYWNASDIALALSYARRVTDRFSIGGSGKYIKSSIWHEQASQFALDLGLIFETQFNGLKIGATLRNFGGQMQLSGQDLVNRIDLDPTNKGNNENIPANLKTDPWPLPLTFTVGASMPVVDTRALTVVLSADAVRPTDNVESFNFGTEIIMMNILKLRAGYQSLFQNTVESGASLGFGLQTPIQGFRMNLDYAFQEFGRFGNVHTWALTFNM